MKISHNIVSFYFESEVLLHVTHDKEGSANQQNAVWLSQVLIFFQQEVQGVGDVVALFQHRWRIWICVTFRKNLVADVEHHVSKLLGADVGHHFVGYFGFLQAHVRSWDDVEIADLGVLLQKLDDVIKHFAFRNSKDHLDLLAFWEPFSDLSQHSLETVDVMAHI